MNKLAQEKIAHEYYNLGVQLALQNAGIGMSKTASKGKNLLSFLGGAGAGAAGLKAQQMGGTKLLDQLNRVLGYPVHTTGAPAGLTGAFPKTPFGNLDDMMSLADRAKMGPEDLMRYTASGEGALANAAPVGDVLEQFTSQLAKYQ